VPMSSSRESFARLRQALDDPGNALVAGDGNARAMPGLARFFGREALDPDIASGRAGWRLCGAHSMSDGVIHIEPGLLPQVPDFAGNRTFLADIMLDDIGLRRDAAGESRFERNAIEAAQAGPPSQAAQAALAVLRRAPAMPALLSFGAELNRARVLVIDQHGADDSIALAGATSSAFTRMLAAARSENPEHEIWLLPANAGAQAGLLYSEAVRAGVRVLPFRPDPVETARLFDIAYTVSDAYGWDLLVQGMSVRCFALPFYAGWGLTRDDRPHTRRAAAKVEVGHLVDAGLVQAGSFINPLTGVRVTLNECLELGRDVARQRRANAGLGVFHHIQGWKRGTIAAMFVPDHPAPRFHHGIEASVATAAHLKRPLVGWSSSISPALVAKAEAARVPIVRMEDGFIRSVGLGAAGYQPLSLVIDDIGIYYDCNRPSRLEKILSEAHFDDALRARARSLVDKLVDAQITKYNLDEPQAALGIPAGRRVIFVPGQVEDDASILLGGGGMTAERQLALVRERMPDAYILYKPHPDVSSGLRKGLADRSIALRHADAYVEDVAVLQLLACCDEVHTITSLTGFEGLLRGKSVTCYGSPFYAGWGLTTDLTTLPRRGRRLSLEELVAGTLILYPHYLDPMSGLHANPEIAIARIAEQKLSPPAAHRGMQVRAMLLKLLRGLQGWR